MGVPYPAFVKNMLDALHQTGNQGKGTDCLLYTSSGVSGGGREKPSARLRAGGDGLPAPASQTGHPAAEIGDGL